MAKKKAKKTSVLKKLAVPALLVLAVVGFFSWNYLSDNKIPNVVRDADLYVRPGASVESVLASLDSCVLRPGSVKRCFGRHEVATYMKPGHYSVKKGQTSVYLARMLNNGWQTPVKLKIPSVRMLGSLARSISNQMMVDSATVHNAVTDPALLSKYGFTPATVYALFMPDTYEVFWTESVEELLDRQKKAYDAFWTEERLAKARKLGLSKMEVSVLASIVKGESNKPDDYRKIAGVYLNRIRKGMRLQADPTVAFLSGYTKKRILLSDLRTDSPYNTYIYTGLPPGPISVPDKTYLEAALDPDTKDGYLFFCADPSFNGYHVFARTFEEHKRNARAYQKALSDRLASK